MAERLRGVPVVKAADRYEGGLFAIEHLEKGDRPFLFILDDGFQHWRIERDVDIVLVDGLNPFGNRRLLPLGPLRAPLCEIAEADVLVITKTINETVAAELKTLNDKAPVFFSYYDPDGVRDAAGNLSDISMLADKKVYAFCGIANPESLRNTLSLSGCHLSGLKEYRDHHSYAQKDIAEVADTAGSLGADYIITTEKDMVKIRELGRLPGNLLWLSISFRAEDRFYDEIFGRISA
jgi:tetraacyldisaccharide 4'-kinase